MPSKLSLKVHKMTSHRKNTKASSKSKQNKLHKKEGEERKIKTNQEKRTWTETKRKECINLRTETGQGEK
jgi:hypothetical protein